MKIITSAICALAIMSLLTSCNRQVSSEANPTQSNTDSETVYSSADVTSAQPTPQEEAGSESDKVIAEGDHYRLVSNGTNSTAYYIFDANGNTVWKKYSEGTSTRIGEQDNVVAVSEKSGYELSEKTMYYSVDKDLFSSTYYDVAAYENGLAVYPEADGSGIVIESVFDSSVYVFLERELDSADGESIKSAHFQDNTVVVEYKCFDNGNSTTVTEEVDLADSGSQTEPDGAESTPDKVVAEGDHYRLVSHGGKHTTYYIFDANGNTAAKKYNYLKSATVSEQDRVVIICEGFGDGPTETMYYSVDKDLFCSTYYDVAAFENGVAVYPKADGSGIVIESVFDSSVCVFLERDLDMAWGKAIENAYFQDDTVVVEYRCFEDGNAEESTLRTEKITLCPKLP